MNLLSVRDMVQKDGIIFLSYGGFLTQSLVVSMTEALEKKTLHFDIALGDSTNIFTIFVELAQNVMNYAKEHDSIMNTTNAEGIVLVSKDEESIHVHSQNIIEKNDIKIIDSILSEIMTLSKEEIKENYRQLRRNGTNKHGNCAGIGFYEIAKRCDELKYEFIQLENGQYYFHIVAKVITKKEN